jgi:hypothetical protein
VRPAADRQPASGSRLERLSRALGDETTLPLGEGGEQMHRERVSARQVDALEIDTGLHETADQGHAPTKTVEFGQQDRSASPARMVDCPGEFWAVISHTRLGLDVDLYEFRPNARHMVINR